MSRILKLADRFSNILKRAGDADVKYEKHPFLVALDRAGLSNDGTHAVRAIAVLKRAGMKNFFGLMQGMGQCDYSFKVDGASASEPDISLSFNDSVDENTKSQITAKIKSAFDVLIAEQLKVTSKTPNNMGYGVSMKWQMNQDWFKNFPA